MGKALMGLTNQEHLVAAGTIETGIGIWTVPGIGKESGARNAHGIGIRDGVRGRRIPDGAILAACATGTGSDQRGTTTTIAVGHGKEGGGEEAGRGAGEA